MMTNEEMDAIMSNPMLTDEYKQKLIKEQEEKEHQLTDEEKKVLDEQQNNPINKINNPLVQTIVETLNDPTKSKIYRDQILFGNEWKDWDRMNTSSKQNGIQIPIVSIQF